MGWPVSMYFSETAKRCGAEAWGFNPRSRRPIKCALKGRGWTVCAVVANLRWTVLNDAAKLSNAHHFLTGRKSRR